MPNISNLAGTSSTGCLIKQIATDFEPRGYVVLAVLLVATALFVALAIAGHQNPTSLLGRVEPYSKALAYGVIGIQAVAYPIILGLLISDRRKINQKTIERKGKEESKQQQELLEQKPIQTEDLISYNLIDSKSPAVQKSSHCESFQLPEFIQGGLRILTAKMVVRLRPSAKHLPLEIKKIIGNQPYKSYLAIYQDIPSGMVNLSIQPMLSKDGPVKMAFYPQKGFEPNKPKDFKYQNREVKIEEASEGEFSLYPFVENNSLSSGHLIIKCEKRIVVVHLIAEKDSEMFEEALAADNLKGFLEEISKNERLKKLIQRDFS